MCAYYWDSNPDRAHYVHLPFRSQPLWYNLYVPPTEISTLILHLLVVPSTVLLWFQPWPCNLCMRFLLRFQPRPCLCKLPTQISKLITHPLCACYCNSSPDHAPFVCASYWDSSPDQASVNLPHRFHPRPCLCKSSHSDFIPDHVSVNLRTCIPALFQFSQLHTHDISLITKVIDKHLVHIWHEYKGNCLLCIISQDRNYRHIFWMAQMGQRMCHLC